MKKFLFSSLFILALVSAKTARAEETCMTGVLDCPNGFQSLTLVCGADDNEIMEEMNAYVDALCYN